MSFFSRLKNIIKSNINSNEEYIATDTDYIFQENKETSFEEEKEPEYQQENNIEAEYFAILEVSQNADFETIKKAYKKLLKKYHPDLFHNNPQKLKTAEKLTEKINEAYNYFEQKYKN